MAAILFSHPPRGAKEGVQNRLLVSHSELHYHREHNQHPPQLPDYWRSGGTLPTDTTSDYRRFPWTSGNSAGAGVRPSIVPGGIKPTGSAAVEAGYVCDFVGYATNDEAGQRHGERDCRIVPFPLMQEIDDETGRDEHIEPGADPDHRQQQDEDENRRDDDRRENNEEGDSQVARPPLVDQFVDNCLHRYCSRLGRTVRHQATSSSRDVNGRLLHLV